MRPPRTAPRSVQSGRWLPWALSAAALAAGFTVGRNRGVDPQEPRRRPSAPPRRSTAGPQSYRQLREVLDTQRLRTVFQPVFGLQDGRLLSVEALTRFDRAVPGDTAAAVCPSEWFRRAGELGLGVELELAAIDVALSSSTALAPDVPLSLNASPATLADPRLEGLLDRHEDRSIILEVTEHAIVRDYPELGRAVTRLRERGCRLAVDDAGAGFASLRHVIRLAPEFIKLDASLTQDIEHDPMRRALAASLVLFSRRTGSQLIAEGIERADDLAAWQQLGADGAQGYLLARPGPLRSWEEGPTLVRSGRFRPGRTVPVWSERDAQSC